MSWRHGEKPSRRHWSKVRLQVLDRDGWTCAKCGKAGRLEVDHIKPLEDGGAVYDSSLSKTAARCTTKATCNRSVGDATGRSHAVNVGGESRTRTRKWQGGGGTWP